jgi:hypothetical protein
MEDGRPLVAGFRFTPRVAGEVFALRFFKAESEGGAGHIGKVYDWRTGRLLASTPEGVEDWDCPGPRWVTIRLSQPLLVDPKIEYVAAIDSLQYYTKSNDYPLEGRGNDFIQGSERGGVFSVEAGRIPRESWEEDANYWVDGKPYDHLATISPDAPLTYIHLASCVS